MLNADPTVIYAQRHGPARQALDFDKWQEYRVLDTGPKGGRTSRRAAARVAAGLPDLHAAGPDPGPDRHADPASIDAALHPDTADKYIYFLAIPDGSGKHVFAKTAKQHEANMKKYGYT